MKRLILFPFLLLAITSCKQAPESGGGEHAQHHSMKSSARNYADSVNSGIIAKDTLRSSVFRIAMEYVGKNHVHIEYSSPGVRGRIVWGGLVPYDEVWVAGAHQATSIEFGQDVKINDQVVPAGKYGFFVIPGAQEWTLILNKNWDQHLTDEYSSQEDVLRVTVPAMQIKNKVERLTYSVQAESDQAGIIELTWEQVHVQLFFQNNPSK